MITFYVRRALIRFTEAPARLALITVVWLLLFIPALAITTPLRLLWLTYPLISGPFWVGYLYYLLRFVDGDDPHWNALLYGWRRAFFPSVMSALVVHFFESGLSWVISSIGHLTGLMRTVSGERSFSLITESVAFIFVCSLFFLAFPLIALGERDFARALQRSASAVWRQFADFLGFNLLCALFFLLSAVTVIGLLVFLPIVGLATIDLARYEEDFLRPE
ncbi:MAG: hypothetical protein V2G42_00675 [bacterium JZ-2024 1]